MNLHVTLTPFRNESRVLKETKSLVTHGVFSRIVIVALHEAGLREHEALDDHRSVLRLILKSRNLPRGLIFQFLKYLELAIRILKIARENGVTVINVHSLVLLPIGVMVKTICNATLVYDAHELETEVDGLGGVRQWLAKMVESTFIHKAALTIVVSPGIARWYKNRYPLLVVACVMNCPPFRAITKSTLIHRHLALAPSTRIVIYQGMICSGRGVEELLRAFELTKTAGWALVFMGYGPLESLVREAAQRVGEVFFLPAAPPDEVLAFTSSADVGFCVISDRCLSYELCLPNKLFEYAMAGLPVICSDLPEMARLVRDHDIGFVTDCADVNRISATLKEVFSCDFSLYASRIERFAETYCWENEENVMLDAYREHVLT